MLGVVSHSVSVIESLVWSCGSDTWVFVAAELPIVKLSGVEIETGMTGGVRCGGDVFMVWVLFAERRDGFDFGDMGLIQWWVAQCAGRQRSIRYCLGVQVGNEAGQVDEPDSALCSSAFQDDRFHRCS